ncbi:branched-chain amino acid ABC transporter permease [Fodinicurvata sediminis]|uniref:branched-chain amino acid ABC transporter permease n=1 Tax=Fodinicurvata sediminis TaxID=1121832 RepID=UPI00047E6F74|nr:branched-chain amino acid ABC transporter permease [Fodinicurvata sediminis]
MMYATIQFLNGLSYGLSLFLVAAGLSIIFGVLRVLNFGHGTFYMLGGYIAYEAVSHIGLSDGGFWIAVALSGLVLAVLAAIIERLMLRNLYGREEVYQLLFTFALVLLLSDVIRGLWGTQVLSISFPPGLRGAQDLGLAYYPRYRLFLCLVGIVVAIGIWFVFQRTRWGRIIRAATQDREILGALGINVPLVYLVVFSAGAALAGIGGALAAPALALKPGMDAEIIVECFIVVIIGGLGSLWGAFIGAILIGQLRSIGLYFVPEWEIVLVYLLMVAILVFRPWGLLGKREGE